MPAWPESKEEFLKKPLELIRERCTAELGAGSGGGDCVKGVTDAFKAFLQRQGSETVIPLLTPEAWASDRLGINTLVRFRGMVQDTLDAEFFVGVHKVRETGELLPTLFQDTMQLRAGLDLEEVVPHETMERRRLICVPIPGECPWVMEAQDDHHHQQQQLKQEEACEEGDGCKSDNASQRWKRGFEDIKEMETDGGPGKCLKEEVAMDIMDTDGPIGTRQAALQCTLAYFYGGCDEGSEPKLNEAVDLVGILSFDPVLADSMTTDDQQQQLSSLCQEDDLGFHHGMGTEDLPPSLVPRLHVLAWSRACRLFTPVFDVPRPLPAGLDSAAGMEQAREATLSYLASSLGGDRMAAEYVLLGLVSRVAARTTGSVVGHLPLNLTGRMMASIAPSLKAAIEQLVTRCRALDVTIAGLETGRWSPHKNYTTNRLVTAPLQVTQGTVLLVDETDLQEGQVGPVGLTNLAMLRQLADLMVVSYDFDFYKLDFEADSPFLVLSPTRTILGGPVISEVPVQCDEGVSVHGVKEELDAGALQTLRLYMAAVADLRVEMDDETARQAETDFVAARANGDQTFTQHDLSRWLTLTRLICASYGESRISSSRHWARMKTLEGLRLARRSTSSPNRSSGPNTPAVQGEQQQQCPGGMTAGIPAPNSTIGQ